MKNFKLTLLSFHFVMAVVILFILTVGTASTAWAHGEITTQAVVIDVSTFPPVEEDIAALTQFSSNAKLAGARLIERGSEILSVAHGVLADTNAPYPQRLQLLTVLGEIGDVSSATEIIHSIDDFPNNRYLYQNALLALSKLAVTDETQTLTQAFVNRQLAVTKRDPLIQRSALNYYAAQPGVAAKPWIEKYALNSEANPEVRYTALYMAGMNGVENVKGLIADVLDSQPNAVREYYLLLGFANVASSEEFEALVQAKSLDVNNVEKVREWLSYRLADEVDKNKMRAIFIKSNNLQLKQRVVNELIKNKNATVLAENWQRGDTLVRAAVKRAGFTVKVGETGAELVERIPPVSFSFWWYGFAILVLFSLMFLGVRQFKLAAN